MQKTLLSVLFAIRNTEVRDEEQPMTAAPAELSPASLSEVAGGLAPNGTWAMAPNGTW